MDDGTVQSDPQFNDDSAKHEYTDSDEASDDSLQGDVRSLTDGSVSRKSLPSEGSETISKEEIPAPAPTLMPEAETMVSTGNERGTFKKKSKKSKLSAKLAFFE